MKTRYYSAAKDWFGTAISAIEFLGLLYLLYAVPLGVFGIYFWTGMGMPVRTQEQYDAAVHSELKSAFFCPLLPWILACSLMIWFGRRLRHEQRTLLN